MVLFLLFTSSNRIKLNNYNNLKTIGDQFEMNEWINNNFFHSFLQRRWFCWCKQYTNRIVQTKQKRKTPDATNNNNDGKLDYDDKIIISDRHLYYYYYLLEQHSHANSMNEQSIW